MDGPLGLHEFEAEAARLASSLSPNDGRATLVTLSGGLGAGKTAFAQALAAALGVTEPVTSPTFVLAKSYPLPEGGAFSRLLHMDAYRLSSGAELGPIGVPAALLEPGTLVVLEWPEMVAEALPPADVALTIIPVSETERTLSYA
jgi:tRNA threonylcarbamoyladenosine biosynthesis protein TsaE